MGTGPSRFRPDVSRCSLSDTPEVSIVTATYNRSNVLRYTIMSVLDQALQEWEMIVVGDACTDDTAEVVASFDDPRISFVNLAANTGEQSGPNNEGAARARGRYVAYLNHDDLWLPDHLSTAVAELDRTGADLVFSLGLNARPEGLSRLIAVAASDRYRPHVAVPASLWVLRRELIERVGPWRFYREIYNNPSQDWIYRAWRANVKIRSIPVVTMVKLASGGREGAYRSGEHRENEAYYEAIKSDPFWLQRELWQMTLALERRESELALKRPVKRFFRNVFFRVCELLRVHPRSVIFRSRFGRRGGLIDHLRKKRGLPPLPRG